MRLHKRNVDTDIFHDRSIHRGKGLGRLASHAIVPVRPQLARVLGLKIDMSNLHWSNSIGQWRWIVQPQPRACEISHTCFELRAISPRNGYYWNGIYPFIDYSTSGNIDGMIEAAEVS